MPIYSFRCEACDTSFEVRASFKEREAGLNPICPACQSSKVQQIITAGLLLRGSNGSRVVVPACGPSAKPGCCG